jgi:hypothetical protein
MNNGNDQFSKCMPMISLFVFSCVYTLPSLALLLEIGKQLRPPAVSHYTGIIHMVYETLFITHSISITDISFTWNYALSGSS